MADDPRVAQAKALLDTFGEWIDKYRGGMSRELAATIMLWESGGNFAAPGDPSLGEVGYYQVAAYVPPLFGLPAEARLDPESNVAIGLAEYNMENLQWYLSFPTLIDRSSEDAWKLARLSFAIGRGGAMGLAAMASAHSAGDVFGDILRYVQANGAPALGSQTGTKVAQRVADIVTQFGIADGVGSNNFSAPQWVTDGPPTYADQWTEPADLASFYSQPISATLLLALGGLLLATYWFTRD